MMAARLFICHSHLNNDWVVPFVANLRSNDFDVWFDNLAGISGGNEWWKTIVSEIELSDIFILILTPESIESNWVQEDLGVALSLRKKIIVVEHKQTQISGFLSLRQIIRVSGLDPIESANYVSTTLSPLALVPVLPKQELDAPKLFISHSSHDNSFATQLVMDLEKSDAHVWVDFAQIEHGDFYKRINQGLSQSNWFILIVSPAIFTSNIIELEVNAAFGMIETGEMNDIIPIVAAPFDLKQMPPLWRQLHRYDAVNDYLGALNGLKKAVGLL